MGVWGTGVNFGACLLSLLLLSCRGNAGRGQAGVESVGYRCGDMVKNEIEATQIIFITPDHWLAHLICASGVVPSSAMVSMNFAPEVSLMPCLIILRLPCPPFPSG